MTPPELSRLVRVEHIGEGMAFTVEATGPERDAVAARLGVVAVPRLVCSFDLTRPRAGTVVATGVLNAEVVQTCVVSLEPFPAAIEEAFEVNFVPEGTESEDLDLEAVDEIPYAGGVLDLGEAATEQLALALDPFPAQTGCPVAGGRRQIAGGSLRGAVAAAVGEVGKARGLCPPTFKWDPR